VTSRRRALWPDGLAGRFVLLLAGALVAASLVATLAMSLERGRFDRAALAEREVARIVALVPALDALAPERREAVVRRASTRSAEVRLAPLPVVATTPDDLRSRAIEALIRGALGERPLAVAVRPAGDPFGWRRSGPPDSIAISIALSPGVGAAPLWLNVRAQAPPGGPRDVEGDVVLLVLALSLVAVLGVGMLFARRLTRPLEQLARAADAAGRGDRTVRLPEDGPRELRAAARAFNGMQVRIGRFDAERMRTLAAVGHDLRTPITSLRIRAEMLDDDDLREPMVRTLDEMTVMADGLVAYAKGSRDAEPSERVDLGALLRRLCEERGATFEPQAQAAVMARPVALGRALGNLIDNAIRYGGTASVRLNLDGAEAIVAVEDRGPGLPPERLEAVFEPFVRGEDSRSAETGGAGLGLSIARNIVMAHGGAIRLDNSEGGGLRASVRLPVA
jgi:signal transduction histidine kinase